MTYTAVASNTGTYKAWDQSEIKKFYTLDEHFEAIANAVEFGKTALQEEIKDLHNSYLKKTANLLQKLADRQREMSMPFLSAYVRPDDIKSFTSLVIVSKDKYLSEDFEFVYTLAGEIEDEAEKDGFNLSISYSYEAESLRESCIHTSGFFLKCKISDEA